MKHRIPTRRLLIILFWIAVWQTVSMIIQNDIIFVGPADVVRSFFLLLPSPEFWLSIGRSFARISIGFACAFACGILAGSLAFRFRLLGELLDPIMMLIKSIPVASFVILALIWIGSDNLAVFISFLVVFPILYVNTISGLQSTDEKLLEMASVFSVGLSGRIRCIYLPALLPYLTSGCKVALGMSWKSGIAAEVIGVPAHTIGENLYMSKIYLATSDLFAWTIVIILVSALFEKLFLALIVRLTRQLQHGFTAAPVPGTEAVPVPGAQAASTLAPGETAAPLSAAPFCLALRDLTKSYGSQLIWQNLDADLLSGHIYCLMGSSGSGKTTLFRILLGLEAADAGNVSMSPSSASQGPEDVLTAVFQEDRLCESFSPLDNVLLTVGRSCSRSQVYHELCRLLPEESVIRPVSTLSGGMKRRVTIARAVLTPSLGILMDEPFTGLDEYTKKLVIAYIKEKTAGKLLLISTHQEEDIALLDGELLRLF